MMALADEIARMHHPQPGPCRREHDRVQPRRPTITTRDPPAETPTSQETLSAVAHGRRIRHQVRSG